MKLQIFRIFSILTALVVGFWIPLRMLNDQISGSVNLFCDLLVSAASIVNVILFFSEPSNDVERSPKNILSWVHPLLLLDLVCVIPWVLFDLHFFGHDQAVFLFLNLISARHIGRIRSFLDQFDTLSPVIFRLIPIVVMMPLLVHLLACAWIALGSGSAGPDADHLSEYIKAVYWTFTTLTTVGYGDVVAKTNHQMLFACGVQLVGVGVFGFILSNVASLLTRMDAAREHHMDSIDHVETFMQSHNIPQETRKKVRTYFHYLWKRHKGYQDRTLLEGLPAKMQSELYFLINAPVLSKVSLFKDAEENLIEALTSQLQPRIYIPGERIFQFGEVGDSMYFLHHGEIQITAENKSLIATLSEGNFFGEMALITDGQRNATATATTFCDVYQLSKESFRKVLTDYPQFKKHVEAVASQRSKAAA